MQTKLLTTSLVAEMLPLPVSRHYGNSYRRTSSQSALSGLVELAKRLQDVIAVF